MLTERAEEYGALIESGVGMLLLVVDARGSGRWDAVAAQVCVCVCVYK